MNYYILDDQGNPVPEPDVLKWGKWFENNTDKRRVAFDRIGNVQVSTVFLGLDHNWGEGPPLLYETMVFYTPRRQGFDIYRYATRDEALAGHERAKSIVGNTLTS